ncbi:MAG: hypothetical protein ACTSU5_07995 [Promethearchaeota archaeon]
MTLRRIIIVKWDPSVGPTPLVQFPPEKSFVNRETLLKIWAVHELNNDQPVVTIEIEGEKVLSYFVEYKRSTFFFILLLDPTEEDTWSYQELVSGLASNLVASLDSPNFGRMLSETYKVLRDSTSLNEEQLFYRIYHDKTRRTILEILRGGIISKKSLRGRLFKEFGISPSNMELVMSPFYQLKLVRKSTIHDSEVYVLERDVCCLRVPPVKVLSPMKGKKLPDGSREASYLKRLKEFFQDYDPVRRGESEKTFQVLDLFFDSQTYEVLTLLREAPLKEISLLEMMKTNRETMKALFDDNLIVKVDNFIYLLSDVRFEKFPPDYIIGNLVRRYLTGEIPLDYFLYHVEALKSCP